MHEASQKMLKLLPLVDNASTTRSLSFTTIGRSYDRIEQFREKSPSHEQSPKHEKNISKWQSHTNFMLGQPF
jgi:hypothetical protein